ncbi:metal ABC transporter substrate-binding protein [soil metagenome]
MQRYNNILLAIYVSLILITASAENLRTNLINASVTTNASSIDNVNTSISYQNGNIETSTTNFDPISNQSSLNTYASFYPIYDFVKKIGMEKVNVSTVVPPGIEPHDFEPTAKQVVELQNADLIFINGAGFEEWLDRIGNDNIVELSKGLSIENADSVPDPHIWLDPVLVKNLSTAILDALITRDPQNADYYRNNNIEFNTKLDKLNSDIKNNLTDCLLNDFIAFHDAFGYFANRYGLIQHSIEGLAPEAGVNPQSVSDAINLSRQLNISVIFGEENIDPRLSETIANEIGGRVLLLNPIELISQEEQDLGEDYISKMYDNLNNLKIALGC